MSWKTVLKKTALAVGRWQLAARVKVKKILGVLGPLEILAYPGYGAHGRLRVKARVVERKSIAPTGEQATFLHDMLNMYKRLTRMPLPGALVAVECMGRRKEVETDAQGFVDASFEFDGLEAEGGRERATAEAGEMWQPVDLELLSPKEGGGELKVRSRALMPPGGARFVIVSDIDDTVLPTEATNFLRMMRSLFTGSARTRLPFPGVASLYRGLHEDGDGRPLNPVFYVSRGPWNLYDLLSEFFNLHDIPIGPVLYLRDWGLSEEGLSPARPRGHKFQCICDMLRTYEELPFILIGDSGQLDPWIYAEVIQENPGRILAVYIRKVPTADEERLKAIATLAEKARKAGCDFVLAEDSQDMARHAVRKGLVPRSKLVDLVEEKIKGEEPPELAEDLKEGAKEKVREVRESLESSMSGDKGD